MKARSRSLNIMLCKALVTSFLRLIVGVGEDHESWTSEKWDHHVEHMMMVLVNWGLVYLGKEFLNKRTISWINLTVGIPSKHSSTMN